MLLFGISFLLSILVVVSGKPHYAANINKSIRKQDDFWRIDGGIQAEMNEFPYMAMLTHETGILFCGAVLIGDYYVLTAAHCLFGKSAKNVIVRLGDYDQSTDEETIHENIRAAEFIPHPKFDYTFTFNDLALVKMARAASRNPVIAPICLPPPEETFAGETAILSGWGATDVDGFATNFLQKGSMTVLESDDCKSRLRDFNIELLTYLSSTKVCAWEDKINSCKGDSGGPLVVKNPETEKGILVGISSLSFWCASKNLPGVYTRVNSYLDWIKANTKDDSSICWS